MKLIYFLAALNVVLVLIILIIVWLWGREEAKELEKIKKRNDELGQIREGSKQSK